MTIDPEPAGIRWIHDVFGNCIALVDIDRPADQLRFETNIRLDHTPQVPLDLEIDRKALTYPFSYDDEEMTDLSCTITRHYEDPGVRSHTGRISSSEEARRARQATS